MTRIDAKRSLQAPSAAPTSTLLHRIIDTPNLIDIVRALPNHTFSSLIRHIGVEDAGELIALATTQQLTSAFDEDLFVNTAPGQREVFDPERFATWLEVLLEAGDEPAAQRISALSEDFLVLAFSNLMTVLNQDALRDSMYGCDDHSADALDKALESSLIEEIDGYLLVAKVYEGWDATLSLILALDRDQRPLLVQILDRCAALTADTLDDLDALTDLLSCAESLAEDVEAARDARRSSSGFIEPRAAKSFLALAQQPTLSPLSDQPRDAITRMYFRDLSPPSSTAARPQPPADAATDAPDWLTALPSLLHQPDATPIPSPSPPPALTAPSTPAPLPFAEALKRLQHRSPARFAARTSELAFLANVLLSGAANGAGRRLRPAEASQAALCTVALGAALEAHARANLIHTTHTPTHTPNTTHALPSCDALCDVLNDLPADLLFRKASSALAAHPLTPAPSFFVHSPQHLAALLNALL